MSQGLPFARTQKPHNGYYVKLRRRAALAQNRLPAQTCLWQAMGSNECDRYTMVDRFVIAATVDRLIYESEATFAADDARLLLDAIPHKPSPWLQLGFAGKMSGGSTKGYAAGVGDVKIKDDKDRTFEYRTSNDVYTRAGQWKMMWIGKRARQYIEIEQVMADAFDEGRGVMIAYDLAGTPLSMDIQYNRAFRILWSPVTVVIPGWKSWKTPV